MSTEDALAKLKIHVRSLLVSSKLGLSPMQLRRDYENMLGHPMPLKELGFRSVMDMAREMPDVVSLHYRPDGTAHFTAVCDESTQEIASLVAKQRLSCKKKKNPGYQFYPASFHKAAPQVLPRRGRVPPALPAQLRAQLRILLSQGPIRVSDLQSCYCRCFGHPLNVHNYGFYSTGEMLAAVADLVCIQQSRFGSVLVLTEHLERSQNYKPSGKPSTGPKTSGLGPTTKPISRVPDSQVIVPTKPAAAATGQQSPHPSRTPAEPVQNSSVVADEAEVVGKVDETKPVPSSKTFEKQVLKLEEELRQQIIKNSISGVVSQDLKDKLLKVLSQANGGLSVHDLPAHYKRLFDEELPFLENGFVSVTELVAALTDIILVKPANDDDKNHLIVMDVNNLNNKQLDAKTHDPINYHEDLSPEVSLAAVGKSSWEEETESNDSFKTQKIEKSEMYPPIQVHHSPAVPLDALLDQRLKPPPRRAVRQLVEVLVESVESPGLFYIRFIESEEATALGRMMIDMKRYYSCSNISKQYQLPAAFMRQGQVCCALAGTSWYYRVVIHRVINPVQAEVYFVDFGMTLVVPSTSLKFLKSIYSVLPAQAVPASLSRIKPISGTWTDEAIDAFRTWCAERFLVGCLDCYTGDVLQLFLCDTSTNEDVYVHDVLLRQGHGTVCSSAASQAWCVKVTPVSLYLGKGMMDLPGIKISTPESGKQPLHSLAEAQKVEEDEMPDLEVIELNEKIQVQDMDLNQSSTHSCEQTLDHNGSSEDMNNESPAATPESPSSSPLTFSHPSQTPATPAHVDADSNVMSSLSTPSSSDSNSLVPALQDVQQPKVTDSSLVQPPLIWRMLGLNTSIPNKSPDSPVASLNLRRSGSFFPLFGGGSL